MFTAPAIRIARFDRRADRRTIVSYFRRTLVMYYWCILGALAIWWALVGLNLAAVYRLASQSWAC